MLCFYTSLILFDIVFEYRLAVFSLLQSKTSCCLLHASPATRYTHIPALFVRHYHCIWPFTLWFLRHVASVRCETRVG